MKFTYPEGATSLDPDKITGLIPGHITTQNQLNEWEAKNILKAEEWATSKKHPDVLTIAFIRKLHKKMFAETWEWAGTFRNNATNIGVDCSMITTKLKELLDDIHYWIAKKTYPIDEIAYRFHHRLVAIHPFCNGNGRHARLITDILLTENDCPIFTWGRRTKESETIIRNKYIAALKKADQHDYQELKTFVLS